MNNEDWIDCKPCRHSYKCFIVGRESDLKHCCIGSVVTFRKGKTLPRSWCSEWISLGYLRCDCPWQHHTKGKKSCLAISNGPMCVFLCVHVYVWAVMWCEPLLLGNPTVWDLTAPTAVSMTGWKSVYVCVTQIVKRRRKWPKRKKERDRKHGLFTHKNKYIHLWTSLWKLICVSMEKLHVSHPFERAQQATTRPDGICWADHYKEI